MMELTFYLVGESRNDAATQGLMFDDFKGAAEWAGENDLLVYKATAYLNPEEMYEVDEEEED